MRNTQMIGRGPVWFTPGDVYTAPKQRRFSRIDRRGAFLLGDLFPKQDWAALKKSLEFARDFAKAQRQRRRQNRKGK